MAPQMKKGILLFQVQLMALFRYDSRIERGPEKGQIVLEVKPHCPEEHCPGVKPH